MMIIMQWIVEIIGDMDEAWDKSKGSRSGSQCRPRRSIAWKKNGWLLREKSVSW